MFEGCVFSVAGFLTKSSVEVSKAVKENGGVFSLSVNNKTTHVLVSESEWKAQSYKVKCALTNGALVLQESFLWDSIQQKNRLPELQYAFSHIAIGPVRRPWDDTLDEDKETPLSVRGKAKAWRYDDALAPGFPKTFQVVRKDVLQVTEFTTSQKKFYCLELHQGKENGKEHFRVFAHYGRSDLLETNPNACTKECRYLPYLADANDVYDALYGDKTSLAKGYKHFDLVSDKIGSSVPLTLPVASSQNQISTLFPSAGPRVKIAPSKHPAVTAPVVLPASTGFTRTAAQIPVSSLFKTSAPEDSELKAQEDRCRRLFAQDRSNPELNNMNLLLLNVFDNRESFVYNNQQPETPLILHAERDQRPKSGYSVCTREQFTSNFEQFTHGIFRGMKWNNVFLAGGCVLASLLQDSPGDGFKSSDVDIFLYSLNQQQANKKLEEIHDLVKANVQSKFEVIRTKHAVTIINQFPFRHLQIILRLYKSPAEVLMGFDVDCCSVGYDGQNVWAIPRARRAITRGYNLVDMSRRSLTYEVRLYKYSKRGFAVAIPGFDRSHVNPAIFEKSLREVKGLAQLLVLEYNTLRNLKSLKNPFKSDHVATHQVRCGGPDEFSEERLQEFEGLKGNRTDFQPDSDYCGLYIPWGPQWFSWQIMNLLNYQDKAQFFAKKDNIRHRHLFVSGIQGVLEGKSFWCRKCREDSHAPPYTSSVQQTPDDDNNVTGPIKWLEDNPGRQLMTGSFHPIDDTEWDKQAYRNHDEDSALSLLDACFQNDAQQVRSKAISRPQGDAYALLPLRTTPLHLASLLGNGESARGLIDASGGVDVKDDAGYTPLHYAAASGHVEVVQYLLSVLADVAAVKEGTGITPLHLACYYNRDDVLTILLENVERIGGNANPKDAKGRNLLFYAALGDGEKCCRVLLKELSSQVALITQPDSEGVSPLQIAVNKHSGACVDYFLSVSPIQAPRSTHLPIFESLPADENLPALTAVANDDVGSLSRLPDLRTNESDEWRIYPLFAATVTTEPHPKRPAISGVSNPVVKPAPPPISSFGIGSKFSEQPSPSIPAYFVAPVQTLPSFATTFGSNGTFSFANSNNNNSNIFNDIPLVNTSNNNNSNTFFPSFNINNNNPSTPPDVLELKRKFRAPTAAPKTSVVFEPRTTDTSPFVNLPTPNAPAGVATMPVSRLLLLFSLLYKGNKVSDVEKGKLKDLALRGDSLLLCALECYEVDNDLNEFADTVLRLLSLRSD